MQISPFRDINEIKSYGIAKEQANLELEKEVDKYFSYDPNITITDIDEDEMEYNKNKRFYFNSPNAANDCYYDNSNISNKTFESDSINNSNNFQVNRQSQKKFLMKKRNNKIMLNKDISHLNFEQNFIFDRTLDLEQNFGFMVDNPIFFKH